MNKIPLAYDMFENVLEDMSDKNLNETYTALMNFKQRNYRSYALMRNVPFIRDLFDLVIDQHGYRHAMEEELAG